METFFNVFMKFRGSDICNKFISYLYFALIRKNIIVFIDNNKLQREEEIQTSLLSTIECPSIAIVVLSRYYAYSPFCLDELIKIVECKEFKGQVIFPIFNEVDPKIDVGLQAGYYEHAFDIYEADFAQENVEAWRSALRMVAGLVAWHMEDENKIEINQDIVTAIQEKLTKVWPRTRDLLATTRLVGKEFRYNMRVVLSWLTSDQVSSIGIYGISGVRKIKLVTRIYNKLVQKKGLFPCLHWGTMSQDFSIHKLQDHIAKIIGLKFDGEVDTWKRATILSHELNKHHEFLFVMDDLVVQEVGIPIERNGNYKLLIVTKFLEVVRKMICPRKLEVLLHEDEAWELFEEKLALSRELTSNEKKIAKSIVKECGGWPQGIVLIAVWMGITATDRQWNFMLQILRDSSYGELDIEETKVLSTVTRLLHGSNYVDNSFRSTIAYLPVADYFFHKVQFQDLEVLNLSNTNLEILPMCIVELHNLRALFLRNCRRLRQVPSLAGLKMLVLLDLCYSENIKEVPEGLESVSKLKYLNLYRTGLKEFPIEILENLTGIQFLASGVEIDSSFEVEVEDLANLKLCVI